MALNGTDELFFKKHMTCDNLSEATDYFSTGYKAIFGTWLVLTIIAAIFGNLLVIIVILTNRTMRDITNMFLLSLAIADLMVGLLMAPLAFYTLLKGCWNFGELMCTANSFINSVLLVTSIHTLMYMAIYKFWCIYRVSNDKFLPPKRWIGNLMIGLAWAWGIFLAVLTTKLLSGAIYKPKTMQCGPFYPELGTTKSILLHWTNQFINLYIPVGVMTFAYINIYIYKRRSAQFQRQMSVYGERQQQQQSLTAVAKTLFIVLVCFILCWLPYIIYTNWAAFLSNKADVPTYLNPLAYCCGYMNSACNPIIYAWRFPEFRKGYKDILCRRPQYMLTIGPLGRPVVTTRRTVRNPSSCTTASNFSNPGSRGPRESVASVGNDKKNGRSSIKDCDEIMLRYHDNGRDSVFLRDDRNNDNPSTHMHILEESET